MRSGGGTGGKSGALEASGDTTLIVAAIRGREEMVGLHRLELWTFWV